MIGKSSIKGWALAILILSFGIAAASEAGQSRYPIRLMPLPDTWNSIIPLVTEFQDQTPAKKLGELDQASRAQLKTGVAVGFVQKVAPDFGKKATSAGVEISRLLIEMPYPEFVEKFPPENWGTRLAHYLGGEVEVLERDSESRAVRQVERMVLALNQDMTKAEVIVYEPNRATVYWRVFHSDNRSTGMDLGSVEFAAYDATSVLITFHSAHRLRTLGVPLLPALTTGILKKTFLDHARKYRD